MAEQVFRSVTALTDDVSDHIPLAEVRKIVCVVSELVKLVKETVEKVKANKANCDRTLALISDLETCAEEYDDVLEAGTFPSCCKNSFERLKKSLEYSQQICLEIKGKKFISRVLKVDSINSKLYSIEAELQSTIQYLKLTMQIGWMAHENRELQTIKHKLSNVESLVMNPKRGVYLNPQCCKELQSVEKPLVRYTDDEKKFMQVSWTDTKNKASDVDRYEILLDPATGRVVNCELRDLIRDKNHYYSVLLDSPVLKRGHLYDVQVRAVNGKGPSQWSESSLFRFKEAVPQIPQMLTAFASCADEIEVHIKVFTEDDEFGSPLEQCIIEYTEKEDTNLTVWNTQTFQIFSDMRKKSKYIFTLKDLKHSTRYYIRVYVKNKVGAGKACKKRAVLTKSVIPGPPDKFRVSAKRTTTSLRVRWKLPSIKPDAVHEYRLEYRKKKSKNWISCEIMGRNDRSKLLEKLDTNTKYFFRIESINRMGEGSMSEEIQGETLIGKLGQAAVVTGSFIGGTLGGPVLGGVAFGGATAVVVSESTDNKAAKVAGSTAAGVAAGAGGVLLGTIGAPLVGVGTAVTAYALMQGDYSPPTSEDES